MTKSITFLILLAAVSYQACAQAPTRFTAQHTIHFVAGTDQERQLLSAIPSVRDLVAEKFEIAREDLNDDGSKEIILIAASSFGCGSGGCSIVVLENRAGKAVAILDNINLPGALAVTNEKIGQYRALAVVDDKGAILSGDQRDTSMFGKQMVYAMKVSEAAPTGSPRTNMQSQSVCVGHPTCAEVPSFFVIVTDFRLSNNGRERVITATMRFVNKMNRALVLGYVQNSGIVMDDQGNRYNVPYSNPVRGIGEIVGDRLDPKFSLSPAERSDARFEFAFDPGSDVILGTKYEIDLTVREIDSVTGNQWRLGKEYALHFRGFTDDGILPTTPADSAPPTTTLPSTAAAPSIAPAPAATPVAPMPGGPASDPCVGTPRCYNAGPFIANITQVTTTASRPALNTEHFVKVTMKIRNVSSRDLILAYRARSEQLTDDAGNRYDNESGFTGGRVSGIGVITGSEVDTGFVLHPGEARDATFDNRLSIRTSDVLGTVFNYDLTLEELEVLPSKQVRSAHTYVVGFHDFKGGAASAAAPAAALAPTPATAPESDPCVGTPRCYNAGPFIASISQLATTVGRPATNTEHFVKVTMKIRNVSNRDLVLAYQARSEQLTDDAGNRYDNEFTAGPVGGIGVITGSEVDTRFVLHPGETRDATFDNRLSIRTSEVLGTVFNYDLTLEELEVLPSKQVRSVQTYAVGFHDFKRTKSETLLDATRSVIKRP